MQRLVMYTYFFIQFFSVSFGLIQVELAMKGVVDMHEDLWLLQVIKPILLAVFALAAERKTSLSFKYYLPQIIIDLAYVFSTSNQTSWLVVGSGYILLCVAMINWTSMKIAVQRHYPQAGIVEKKVP
ncbi:MAG: hypothetical protein EOP07_01470 [Proteobacteria bacterium]|nr:MAG: hypothetical protein EOP07_01470 [Pseudomonadota bacterium]